MNKNLANYIFPLITQKTPEGIRFCLESRLPDCGVIIYDLKSGEEIKKIPFEKSDRIGNLYCKTIPGLDPENISYLYYSGRTRLSDARATGLLPGRSYGMAVKEPLRAVICDDDYDWEGDSRPFHRYEDSFFYLLHVRGFTKSPSSGVKNKGTFAGITEKIGHLKEIGITAIELQPAYEFIEWDGRPSLEPSFGPGTFSDRSGEKDLYTVSTESIISASASSSVSDRLNYWGYKPGFYYAPKESYSASNNPVKEFKDMVRALHEADIEICMQFYFVPDFPESEILEILRYWVVNFHIDGFHLMGLNIPMRLVSADSLLAGTKILSDHIENINFSAIRSFNDDRVIGLYADDFQYPLRRILKSDEGMVSETLSMLRSNPEDFGRMNYLTSYRGFTMMDLVSYDRKHNDENGENGRDGSDYNFSWNCGEEGPSRKKKIRDLRIRQIKNAYSLLMISAGTPLIFMGDEFGNSQKGNNNPYCIDSSVTWLDWKDESRNPEILDHLKELVALRKRYGIFHKNRELYMADTENCGYPEISYHSETAWRVSAEYYSRSFGIMFCENNARSLLYCAYNLGWENTKLALPKPPKGYEWKTILSTDPAMQESIGKMITGSDPSDVPIPTSPASSFSDEKSDRGRTNDPLERDIPGRCVVFFETCKAPAEKVRQSKVFK